MSKTPLLAAILSLPFFACDRKGSGASEAPGGSLQAVTPPAKPDAGAAALKADAPSQAAPSSLARRLQASLPGKTPASVEELAQTPRTLFDGDAKRGGAVSPGAVVVPSDKPAKERKAAYTAPQRKDTLKTKDPPSPVVAGTLPRVELPEAGPGDAPEGSGPVLAAFGAFQRKMYEKAYPLLSRLGWGASPPSAALASHHPARVTVHHTQGHRTLTEDATKSEVKGIQRYHMVGRAAQGKETFSDIGYHFLIDGEGRVVEGRPADSLGAHAGGANLNNLGVAMMGDYNKIKPNDRQIESLTRLVTFLALKYRADPRQKGFLMPHQHFNNTDCPGVHLMEILDRLRGLIDSETLGLVHSLTPATSRIEFTPLLVTEGDNV